MASASTIPMVRLRELVTFCIGYVSLILIAGVLSACLPVSVAIGAVFLFAGPHNWFELRYVLERLPARAGRLWPFFGVSALGIAGLTIGFALLPWLATDRSTYWLIYSAWQSVFLLWIAELVQLRSKTNPRFDAGWVWPSACLLIGGVWIWPSVLPLTLVYLHPLMAIGLLDRELARSRPEWQFSMRIISAGILVALVLIAWTTWERQLAGTDQITLAFGPTLRTDVLAQHAGAGTLKGVSPYSLVAAHTFLELIHYGVWVVLIPLVGLRSWPWDPQSIPLVRRGPSWSRSIVSVLLVSLSLVVILWASFWIDYETTRRIYFTLAIFHVLAEVPLLLRMV